MEKIFNAQALCHGPVDLVFLPCRDSVSTCRDINTLLDNPLSEGSDKHISLGMDLRIAQAGITMYK